MRSDVVALPSGVLSRSVRVLTVFACLVLAASSCSADPVPSNALDASEGASETATATSQVETATSDSSAAATEAEPPVVATTEAEPSPNETSSTDDQSATLDPEQARVGLLLEHCEAGSNMACDVLIMNSDDGSPEETIALLCGGRSDERVLFCTEGFEHKGRNTWFEEDSPGLPGMVTLCEDGDMTACDFLFERSAVDSEYETIGDGCAYRTDSAVPDCRTYFAEEFDPCPSDLPGTCD